MKTLEIEFFGTLSHEMAEKLYTYIIDGGLQDQLEDHLSDETTEVSMRAWDNNSLKILFECQPSQE